MKYIFVILFVFLCSLAQAQWVLSPQVVDTSQEWLHRKGLDPDYLKMADIYMKSGSENPEMPRNLYDKGYRFVVLNQDHYLSFIPKESSSKTYGLGIAKAGTWLILDTKRDSTYIYPYCLNRIQVLKKIPVQTKPVIQVIHDTTLVIKERVPQTPAGSQQGSSGRGITNSVSGRAAGVTRSVPETVYTDTKKVPVYEVGTKREPRWGIIAAAGAVILVGIIDKITDGKLNLFGLIKSPSPVYEPHMKTGGGVDDPAPTNNEEHKKTE